MRGKVAQHNRKQCYFFRREYLNLNLRCIHKESPGDTKENSKHVKLETGLKQDLRDEEVDK